MSVRVPDTAECLGCGYRLRGLPEPRCPECGEPFVPEAPETYRDPARRPSAEPLRPPKPPEPPDRAYVVAWLIVAGAVCVLGSPWEFGYWPDPFALLGCLSVPVMFVFVLDYLRRWFALRAVRDWGDPALLERFNPHRRRWTVVSVCFWLVMSSPVCPWSACLRFYLNWPWFSHAAQEYLDGARGGTGPLRVGLYRVERVLGYDHGCVFFQMSHRGDGARRGFAHRPGGWWSGRTKYPIAPGWYVEEW
ncbi:MAG: hypothetical protein KKB50_10825 [Planctomycetes bacterium]|nr:hypothetical protein [Planctomycetota bacterium]